MTGGEASMGIGMEHARLRKPMRSQGEDASPGGPALLAAAEVCPDFCVNDQVLFLGMGCRGRGSSPSLAHLCRSGTYVHCGILSRAGILPGHRIVKWFSASRQ